uniref:ADP-ribosylglycohydrolase family protein n=1 Tax=Lacrimispora sp. TaxID=2719234 RepID=UPI0028AE2B1B
MDKAKFRHLDKLRSAIYGLAVGDALGVPVEFMDRGSFHVTDMKGYGTHNQPAGTWSDDTSMTLATCDSIRELQKIDLNDIMRCFSEWYYENSYTASGEVFDIGGTTASAIRRYSPGCESVKCGLDHVSANGNGSLMRIIPFAFCNCAKEEIQNVSKLTHAHNISVTACEIYVQIAQRLLNGEMIKDILGTMEFRGPFERLTRIGDLEEKEIASSGYVIHTLEAASWCLLTTNSYEECVLKAVNLGEDTETTGAVAGGLAGIVYGYDN